MVFVLLSFWFPLFIFVHSCLSLCVFIFFHVAVVYFWNMILNVPSISFACLLKSYLNNIQISGFSTFHWFNSIYSMTNVLKVKDKHISMQYCLGIQWIQSFANDKTNMSVSVYNFHQHFLMIVLSCNNISRRLYFILSTYITLTI